METNSQKLILFLLFALAFVSVAGIITCDRMSTEIRSLKAQIDYQQIVEDQWREKCNRQQQWISTLELKFKQLRTDLQICLTQVKELAESRLYWKTRATTCEVLP